VRTRRTRSLLAALAVATVAAAGCASETSTSDATITACTPGTDTEKPKATGQIANNSSKRSSFYIRIVFRDGSGNRVSEGFDTISNVEPGTSSPWTITGLADANGPVDCRVETVRRSVAPGA
jgi:hypothetical protein